MGTVHQRSVETPDETSDFPDGSRADFVYIGDTMVVRSTMLPGWSWEKYVKPMVDSDTCPMFHHEYVLSGRIRYVMEDGSQTLAKAGDYLVIEPGHLATVVGDEPCVTIDWE
jgi:hypothetical protein